MTDDFADALLEALMSCIDDAMVCHVLSLLNAVYQLVITSAACEKAPSCV
jgi:hypothetical protein